MNTTATRTYRIALIARDGIGKEVMPEGLRVLQAPPSASALRSKPPPSTGPVATTTQPTEK